MINPVVFLWCISCCIAAASALDDNQTRTDSTVKLDKFEVQGLHLPKVADSIAQKTVPLRIQPTSDLGFPNALANSLTTDGWARVMISVDAGGNLTDLLVISYTHEAFAREAVRALREWKYLPAEDNGQPTGVRMTLTVDFHDSKGVIKMWQMGDVEQAPGFKHERVIKEIYEPRELDGPVKVEKVIRPVNPSKTVPSAANESIVKIDFIIDEKGRPRMPVVEAAPHDAFAQAAVDALIQWRFTPPTRYGKPVAVQVKKEFVFNKNKRA
jgi:TonB family protein